MAPSSPWLAIRTVALVALVALAALATAPTVAGAQRIVGAVHDSVSGRPVPGAVVSVLDSSGATQVRTIAGQDGRFTLARPDRAAVVRVIRIGFTPRQVPLPPPNAPDGVLQIALLQFPALLTQVRASGQAVCGGTGDRGDALALWEQARAGLLATVVARDTRPGEMRVLSYVTDLDPDTHVVLRQTTSDRSGTTGRPFVASAPAAEFARHGYMTHTGDALTFFAPDADVLLDDAFAATHCFRVTADDAGHPGQIGLAFAPAHARAGFVDVAGTLWIDRAAPRLLTLEYTYTGLDPWYEQAGTGGALAFRTMPNGLSFIERWGMHLPSFTAERPGLGASARSLGRAGRWTNDAPGDPPAAVRLTGLRDVGAQVLYAQWPDGARAETPVGTVTGLVRDRDGLSTPGALVQLDGTETETLADSAGRFALWPVLPGRYGLDAVDSLYAPFIDAHRASRIIDVPSDTVTAPPIVMASRMDGLGRLCHGEGASPSTSTVVVLGRVTAPHGPIGTDVTIRATFEPTGVRDASDAHHDSTAVRPSDEGLFIVCAVPRGTPLRLALMHADSIVAETSFTVHAWPAQQVTWVATPAARPTTGGFSPPLRELEARRCPGRPAAGTAPPYRSRASFANALMAGG